MGFGDAKEGSIDYTGSCWLLAGDCGAFWFRYICGRCMDRQPTSCSCFRAMLPVVILLQKGVNQVYYGVIQVNNLYCLTHHVQHKVNQVNGIYSLVSAVYNLSFSCAPCQLGSK